MKFSSSNNGDKERRLIHFADETPSGSAENAKTSDLLKGLDLKIIEDAEKNLPDFLADWKTRFSKEDIEATISAVGTLDPTSQRELLLGVASLAKNLGTDGVRHFVQMHEEFTSNRPERIASIFASMLPEDKAVLAKIVDTAAFGDFEAALRSAATTPTAAESNPNVERASQVAKQVSGALSKFAAALAPFLKMLAEIMRELKGIMKDFKRQMDPNYDPNAPATDAAEVREQIKQGKHLEHHRTLTKQQLDDVNSSLDRYLGGSASEKKTNHKNRIEGFQTKIDEENAKLSDVNLDIKDRSDIEKAVNSLLTQRDKEKKRMTALENLLKRKKELEARMTLIESKIGPLSPPLPEDAPPSSESEAAPEPEQTDGQKAVKSLIAIELLLKEKKEKDAEIDEKIAELNKMLIAMDKDERAEFFSAQKILSISAAGDQDRRMMKTSDGTQYEVKYTATFELDFLKYEKGD